MLPSQPIFFFSLILPPSPSFIFPLSFTITVEQHKFCLLVACKINLDCLFFFFLVVIARFRCENFLWFFSSTCPDYMLNLSPKIISLLLPVYVLSNFFSFVFVIRRKGQNMNSQELK